MLLYLSDIHAYDLLHKSNQNKQQRDNDRIKEMKHVFSCMTKYKEKMEDIAKNKTLIEQLTQLSMWAHKNATWTKLVRIMQWEYSKRYVWLSDCLCCISIYIYLCRICGYTLVRQIRIARFNLSQAFDLW